MMFDDYYWKLRGCKGRARSPCCWNKPANPSPSDRRHVRTAARRLEHTCGEHMLHLGGQRAEAAHHLGSEGVDIALVLQLSEPPVEVEADREVRHIILRDEHRRPDRDLWRPAVGHRLDHAGLQARHRPLKHLLAKLEAALLALTRLLPADQNAGAADGCGS